ncbi:MAG TPA: hypothetical protein DCQ98_04175 [Planctomycetaceae bacterium]|nr:hypothetical protein [Planctomycetaceae bacterium]
MAQADPSTRESNRLDAFASWSDDRRRAVCRLGFMLGAIVPLLLILWWIATADGRSEWEERLARLTGLEVRITAISSPSLDRIDLADLEFSDPESSWLLRIGQLSLTRQSERWSAVGDRVVLCADRLATLPRRIDGLFELPSATQDEFEMVLRGVTAVDSSGSDTAASFDRMVWTRRAEPEQVTLSARIVPAGAEEESPIQLRFDRSRLALPESTDATTVAMSDEPRDGALGLRGVIDTRGHEIDLEWLALFGLLDRQWGDEAAFRGVGKVTVADGGRPDCELVGRFVDVDLQRFVGSRFRHVLQGRAEIELTRCRIEQGRAVMLSGSLRSSQGAIGLPLVRSLGEELQLQPSDEVLGGSNATVGFRNLIVRFDIEGDRFELDGDEAGTLLADTAGLPLLRVVRSFPRRPQDLVRALVPDSRLEVPLTRETAELLDWLPLPSIALTAPESAERPRGVLRFDR